MTKAPTRSPDLPECWPAFRLTDWKDTYATLHMWTQIVGKIRLALTPLENHWWNAALYVNTRGLTTSPIPYHGGAFEIQFDFVNHRLEFRRGLGIGPSPHKTSARISDGERALNAALRAARATAGSG